GVGALPEGGRIAGGHVVEAHRDGTLVGAGGRVGAVLRAFARGFVNPDEKIAPAAVDLLPHLEEAMHRISDIGGIADVSGYLEWAIRQQLGKAFVGDIARLPESPGRPRLRQHAVAG